MNLNYLSFLKMGLWDYRTVGTSTSLVAGDFPIGSRNELTFKFGADRHTPAFLRTSFPIRKFPIYLNVR